MMDRIRLDAMHERHRALTPAIAGAYGMLGPTQPTQPRTVRTAVSSQGSNYCVIFLPYGGLRPAPVQIITWGQLAREKRILMTAFALKCPALGAEIAVT